jgi:molecular chaperone GrpE
MAEKEFLETEEGKRNGEITIEGPEPEIPLKEPEETPAPESEAESRPEETGEDANLDEILEAEIRAKEEALKNAEKEPREKEEQEEQADPEEIKGKLLAEVEEWKNAYLRKQADFQNFTKRKEKELDELRKYASEKILAKLLDGVDNLHRAIAASESTKDFDGLLKGVDMILTHLNGVMQSEGVEPIEAQGKPYDPVYHHAVMVEDNPDVPEDTVIQELQKGYTMKGKVIRPAMVKVCKRG